MEEIGIEVGFQELGSKLVTGTGIEVGSQETKSKLETGIEIDR